MTILIRFRPRQGMTIDPKLDRRFAGPELRIGRAPDSDLVLRDAAVRFHHAVLAQADAGVTVTLWDGATVDLQAPGDMVGLGHHSLIFDADGPVLVLEPGEIAEEGAAALTAGYLARLTPPRQPVRRWILWLVLAIVVLGFVLPLAAMLLPAGRGLLAAAPARLRPSILWEVGTMSGPHAGFGADCRTCHETAFVPVRSTACLACHAGTGQHADPHRVPGLDLAATRCETCHHEHKGTVQAIRQDQGFCVSCHGDIKGQLSSSVLADVTDFGRNHPEFAPSIVTDAAAGTVTRIRLGTPGPSPDHSNLRFTHAHHLDPAGINGPDGPRVLQCADCHRPDAGGAQMQPVRMERDCLSCHALQFEPRHPDWHLPHGQPQEVASRVLGFYSSAVLAGESFGPEPDRLFAKPGEMLSPSELPQAAAQSASAAALASSVARATCGECHATAPPAPGADPLAWTVLPVSVPDSFLKLARFDHAKHVSTPCQSCHAAQTSDGGPEALLPRIATCRQCHAGAEGEAQKIASPCVSCHVYHRPELPVGEAAK